MSINSESGSEILGRNEVVIRRSFGAIGVKWLLRYMIKGRLTIITPSGEHIVHCAATDGPIATLVLHRWRALRRLLLGGDIAFADAYINGDWSSPDLVGLISLAAANGAHFERAIGGFLPVRILNRLHHILKPNSKVGSRRNISFHYDLGNAFYQSWLDQTMSYSSAMYDGSGRSLETAQQAKLQRIVDLLNLSGKENILEIGCGWGALALRLAQTGADVTGLTLSTEQLAYAQTKAAEANLADRIELCLQDYRDVTGTFDRIVSIEMIEAVGEQYWPIYFQILRERLKHGGLAVLQVITIHESRFEGYRGKADFIQRYIFPGGMLPTGTIIGEQAERAGLKLASVESFGESYAMTLEEWRRRFLSSRPHIEKLGFGASFQRLWEYYLAYCEAGFRTGAINVGLYVLKG